MLRSCYTTTMQFYLGPPGLQVSPSPTLTVPLVSPAWPGSIGLLGSARSPTGTPAIGGFGLGNVYVDAVVRWFFCDKRAKPLPFPTAFCSAIWDDSLTWNPGIGEPHHFYPAEWHSGWTPTTAIGNAGQCGTAAEFAGGVEITNGIRVDDEDIPFCCNSQMGAPALAYIVLSSPGQAAVGGIAFGATQMPLGNLVLSSLVPASESVIYASLDAGSGDVGLAGASNVAMGSVVLSAGQVAGGAIIVTALGQPAAGNAVLSSPGPPSVGQIGLNNPQVEANLVLTSSIPAVGDVVLAGRNPDPDLNGNAVGGFTVFPAQTLGTGIPPGSAGWAIISVLITDQSAAPIVSTFAQGTLTQIAHIVGPTHAGHNSDLYLYAVPWSGAIENVGVASSTSTAGMIFVLWFPFKNIAGTLDLSVNASGVGPPMNLPFGPNATVLEAYLAAFAYIGTASVPGWSGVFQPNTGSEIHRSYAGVEWWLVNGYFLSTTIASQTATDNPAGGADWSALGVSYF